MGSQRTSGEPRLRRGGMPRPARTSWSASRPVGPAPRFIRATTFTRPQQATTSHPTPPMDLIATSRRRHALRLMERRRAAPATRRHLWRWRWRPRLAIPHRRRRRPPRGRAGQRGAAGGCWGSPEQLFCLRRRRRLHWSCMQTVSDSLTSRRMGAVRAEVLFHW